MKFYRALIGLAIMVYEPLYHALQIWQLYASVQTWNSVNCFYKKDGNNSRYFVAVFDKTIIPLALVGYENTGAYLQERISSENESPI